MRVLYTIDHGEKKISRNAIAVLIMGMLSSLGYLLLLSIAVVTIGKLGTAAGFFGVLCLLVSIFAVIWGILRYDEARTTKRFKKLGIIWNGVNVLIGIVLMMV